MVLGTTFNALFTIYVSYLISSTYPSNLSVFTGLHAEEKSSWVFSRSGDLWLDFNLIMQPWVCGPSGAAELGMKGWDVIYVNNDGKVEKLYALIDGLSTHAHAG